MPDDNGRVRESDLVAPALRLAAAKPDGFISTADLIPALEELFQPAGRDADILEGRSDTIFSQKVRNLISHRKTNFIASGYADYHEEQRGITITPEGRALLGALGQEE